MTFMQAAKEFSIVHQDSPNVDAEDENRDETSANVIRSVLCESFREIFDNETVLSPWIFHMADTCTQQNNLV